MISGISAMQQFDPVVYTSLEVISKTEVVSNSLPFVISRMI